MEFRNRMNTEENTKKKEEKPTVPLEDQITFWNHLNDIQYGSLNVAELKKINTWLVAHNGTWLIQKNKSGYYGVKKSEEGIATLPKVNYPTAFFNLAYGKLPNIILEQIIGFFREVMKRHNDAEAFIQVYWDIQDEKYIVHVPKQRISKASVNYDATENLNVKSRERYVFVYECHSHNSMGAFWSGTDDRDEKELRVYGVFGQLDKDNYASKHRFFVGEEQIDCDLSLVFDLPKEEKNYLVTYKNKQYFVPETKLTLDENPKYILETDAGDKIYVPVESVVLHRTKTEFPENWFASINVPMPMVQKMNSLGMPADVDYSNFFSQGKKKNKDKAHTFTRDESDPFYQREFPDIYDRGETIDFDYEEALQDISEVVDSVLDITNGFEDKDATLMFLENLEFKACLKDLELAIHNYYVYCKDQEQGPTDGRY